MNWEAVIAVSSIIGLVLDLALGVGLWFVNTKAARIDKLEETVTAKAGEVVETRFELLAVEFKGMVRQMGDVVGGIRERLERGDEKFDRQGDGQHKLELQSTMQLAGMKTWAVESFASKAELAAIIEQVQQLRIRVGTFESHIVKGSK